MKNAIFFLRLSSVLMLAWWLGELWEWAETSARKQEVPHE